LLNKNCLITLNHERQATILVEIMKENCLITQDHERQINVKENAIHLIPVLWILKISKKKR
jgi:hypothetical protein